MITVGLHLDGNKVQVEISEGLLLLAVAVATLVALVGFAVTIAFMNHGYHKTFLGRLSFRQYFVKLWDSRTYAPIGKGLDASRADLIQFSR
jgi:positive regulator of sigma E activity